MRNQGNNIIYRHIKNSKYLGINLPKEAEYRYLENSKIGKKSKMIQIGGEIYHVLGLEESI